MSRDGHFDFEDWIDYARGLGSAGQRAAMQDHARLCAECSETAEFLAVLWTVGQGMDQQPVPANWLQKAENIFPEGTWTPTRRLPVLRAILAFDSLEAPAPQHVRATSHSGRHMIYHASDCALDLKLDERPDRNAVSIVGQIMDRQSPDQAVPRTPIFLVTRNKVLASTSSNEFGEFQLACKPKRKLQISFPFRGARVEVSLDDLLREEFRRDDL
jgi:hypothetical protein